MMKWFMVLMVALIVLLATTTTMAAHAAVEFSILTRNKGPLCV